VRTEFRRIIRTQEYYAIYYSLRLSARNITQIAVLGLDLIVLGLRVEAIKTLGCVLMRAELFMCLAQGI
jgi:hypothetical protein